ncbi:hypothetical protein MJ579_23415 [Klebsiella pneumoniae]|nr:hypothetical protein MJ579_23415 [Klebsiella pneumoniae]
MRSTRWWQPLERVVQSLPGILLLMFVAQLTAVINIPGNQMIKPIREPLLPGSDHRPYERFLSRGKGTRTSSRCPSGMST